MTIISWPATLVGAGAIFVGASAAMVLFLIVPQVTFPPEAFGWPSVEGMVAGPSDAPPPAINYRYTVDGIQYMNSNIADGGTLPPGAPIHVYYDPRDPAVAIGTTRLKEVAIAWLAILTALVGALFGLFLYAALRQRGIQAVESH